MFTLSQILGEFRKDIMLRSNHEKKYEYKNFAMTHQLHDINRSRKATHSHTVFGPKELKQLQQLQ